MVGGIGGGGPPGPGKVGGPTGPITPATTGATGPAKSSFGEALGVRGTEQTGAASPLERLRSGEIDRNGYIELRVREATAHLEGVLPPDDLAKVQDQLRDVLENDPDVAALVRAAEIGR